MTNHSAGQIKSAGRRAAAYWFIDGLPEIAFGLVFLIPGILGIVMGVLKESHKQTAWNTTLFLIIFNGFWILFFILCVADRRVLDFFKSRLTYPRTGYARPPVNPAPDQDSLVDLWTPDKRRLEILTLSTARPPDQNVSAFKARTVFTFLTAFIIAQVLVQAGIGRWGIAILMIVLAVAIYTLNRREVRSYSLWSVSPIALAGILSVTVAFPHLSQIFLPWIVGGAWLVVQGGWSLVRYLRSYPRSKSSEQTRS
jgi:hypothetical protein